MVLSNSIKASALKRCYTERNLTAETSNIAIAGKQSNPRKEHCYGVYR